MFPVDEQIARNAVSTRNELERACIRYAETRDRALRDQIVEGHQWLVIVCARQMQRRREPMDDLIQIGNIGLLQALERFDPSFGVTFRTFASATILGVLRRHYRTTWRLKVPRRIQELHLVISRAIEALTADLGRSPSVAELARFVGASDEDVIEAMDAGSNFWPLSLAYGTDTEPALPEHTVQNREYEQVDHRMEIRALLDTLPERDQKVLYLRFFHDKTQVEIGEALGLSQVHVSRIMRAALAQLRGRRELSDLRGSAG